MKICVKKNVRLTFFYQYFHYEFYVNLVIELIFGLKDTEKADCLGPNNGITFKQIYEIKPVYSKVEHVLSVIIICRAP